MNAPFERAKRLRVVALDGVYALDERTGFYERVDLFEEEPSYPHPGLIIAALCLIGWAGFGGMAYCLYLVVEALAG
jgi:hypothetical protein